MKPPQWYLDEPECPEGVEFYFRAFWALSTERQIGTAMGPIPESRIEKYSRKRGLDPEVRQIFIRCIRMMDSAFMEWNSEEAAKLSKSKEGHRGKRVKNG